ncbi:serine/threonine protein kinase [Streptomyces sp. NBC_00249]|uniref:serine/threonine-protein kinase n=1 Tax=Streptomyces sp. NBC_00249 TaxID=2975690 RepID=UPI002259FB8C|nr:serine/threonine-protein kinase [Streptomyces sp. NBC_00249]MCX5195339.1 serine/threonine protein kinase [Streptomyces sp. NBC_00249]
MEARRGSLEGSEIAGYRLEREIGHGAMSVVYRATDLHLDRTVALELFAPELHRDDTFRRRFTHESRIAASIDHPHILPIFEAGETDGVLYLAMRYVPGPDLRVLLDQEGPLPVPAALRIAAPVASALDAAHAHDLVHRDVKPANILVAAGTDSDHPEDVYLTNFGLAKKSPSLAGFTTAGTFVGTVDYMAPEQFSDRLLDGRCDLYSLACVVYETIAGRPPFERDSDMALLLAHMHDPPPALSERRPEIAPGVDAVMAKALAKRPEDRYASCLEFVAELRSAASMPDPPSAPGSASPPLDGSAESTPPGPPFDDDDEEW